MILKEKKKQSENSLVSHAGCLRTVPTFATAHMFCASLDCQGKSGFLMAVPV